MQYADRLRAPYNIVYNYSHYLVKKVHCNLLNARRMELILATVPAAYWL